MRLGEIQWAPFDTAIMKVELNRFGSQCRAVTQKVIPSAEIGHSQLDLVQQEVSGMLCTSSKGSDHVPGADIFRQGARHLPLENIPIRDVPAGTLVSSNGKLGFEC